MESNSIEHIKKNGIYYTPEVLAKYLATPLINDTNELVFDPAYGEGALLLAAESIHEVISSNGSKLQLFGCDIHPVNGLLTHLPQANLKEIDFFDFSTANKYDTILTNPPYIRHQEQNKICIKKYKERIVELGQLSNSSDLWAYFLVKAQLHLNQSGSIGAVLPWAFLQADYAQDLRTKLLNKFERIEVLALNNPYFDNAQERVVLLWLKNYGCKTKSINLAFAKDIESKFEYEEITAEDWTSEKIVTSEKGQLKEILKKLKQDYGFREFSCYADARIGVVTGANDYFIKRLDEALKLGFPMNNLQPIITTTKELTNFLRDGIENLKRLIYVDDENLELFQDYIDKGEESEFNLRSHSKKRKPWYRINASKIPDAFFPYRIASIPFLVFNHCNIQSTNSVHRIYFKKLTKTEMRWIHVSMLSIYGQLALEVNSKTYGRGMLKIEPGALSKSLVLCKKNRKVNKVYRDIFSLLQIGEKSKCVEIATNFVNSTLEIPDDFYKSILEASSKVKLVKKR
ncbi:N-6 DNA methylase [Flagellimonas sp.]|uniref:N-6 DNA methylase n=1 Tax=Flagellimonas sp. TaxID=2058762 RepID=UPI003B509820